MSAHTPNTDNNHTSTHLDGGSRGGHHGSERRRPIRELSEGLISPPIKTIDKPEATGADIVLKDLTYLGSYNWTDAEKPTIIVPGSPPMWRDRPVPFTITPDKGLQFVDQNAFRMPSSPLYPLFRAVDVVAEESGLSVAWPDVDIVTDRNGLRKLLRWTSNKAEPFRIDMQLAGRRTVLLSRWEKRARVWTNGSGYGYQFEEETTTKAPGCEKGTGHHRIVKYDFGGLIVVVRFEVDACISESTSSQTTTTSDIDSLMQRLSGMSVGTAASTTSTELDVINAGQQVPHNSIIEVATRSAGRPNNWRDKHAQMYFSQTPHHYLATHRDGEFYEITKHQLDSEEMKLLQVKAQDGLKQLRALLETIQDLLVEHGLTTMLSLVYQDKKLEVFKRNDEQSILPDDVLARFNA